LFWKKKVSSEEKPKKKKKKKKILVKATEETRQSFRVAPSPNEPIRFRFSGKEVSALDISSGGLSFKNNHFAKGSAEEVSFTLPGSSVEIRVKLNLLNIIEAKNMCCCQFQDLDPDYEDAIDSYALERQKEKLKSKKGGYL